MFDFNDPNSAMLLGIGSGLLSAGGPSRTPVNLGQAFGQAMPQAMQMSQMANENQRQNQLTQMAMLDRVKKMQEAQRRQFALEQYGQGITDPQQLSRFNIDPEGFLKSQDEANKPQVVSEGSSIYQGGKSVFTAPKERKLPDGMEMGPDGVPRFMPAYLEGKAKIARAGASSVNVGTQEKEEAKAYGKATGEQYAQIQNAAFSAPGRMGKLQRMENLLSKIETGKAVPIGMTVAGAARSVGIDLDPTLDQKQAFEALSNELALLAKNTADGTNLMPGAMSEADRNFLVQLVPNLGKTKEANQQLIGFMMKLEKRSVDIAKLAREYRKKNGTIEGFSEFAADYAEKNPIASTVQAPKQAGVKFLGFE